MMEKNKKSEKRKIPFDQPIKIGLLFFHVVGFGAWYGGIALSREVPGLFPTMATGSGILLVVRELYKDGTVWLMVSEGVLTVVKSILLVIAWMAKEYEFPLFQVIVLCGILSSHLPDRIRERRILGH